MAAPGPDLLAIRTSSSRWYLRTAAVVVPCAVALLLAWWVLGQSAWRSLDARTRRLAKDLQALEARRAPAARAPLLPAWDGDEGDANAADDYAVVDWFLMSEPGAREPKGAARTGLKRDRAWTDALRLGVYPPHGTTLERMLDEGVEPTPEMRRVWGPRAPVLRCLREAVGRRRCDWGPLEDAIDRQSGAPGILELAFEAQSQPPAEAARTSLVLVAWARDLLHHPALPVVDSGIWALHHGARSVARAMSRGLDREGYQEVADALARLEPIDVRPGAEAQRVSALLDVVGRGTPLDGARTSWWEAAKVDDRWTRIERQAALEGQTLGLDLPARERILDAGLRTQGHWLLTRGTSWCGIWAIQLEAEEAWVEVGMARVLAAAHLRRRETGAFPLDPAGLGLALPEDPLAPGSAVRYAAKRDEVRVWSRGRNLVDDGGTGDDIVLEAR